MTNARGMSTPDRIPAPTDSGENRRADSADRGRDISNGPLPMTDAEPEVGLSQKGTDEDAVLRRETEI